MKNISVLIVEDDAKIREALRVAMKPLFKTIHIARDGYEARELFDNNNIDVVITDMNMPNINGAELIHNIRNENLTIPIVITTGYNGFEELYESMLNIWVLKKPIDIKTIYDLILSCEDEIIKYRKAKNSYEKLEEVSNQAKEILRLLRETDVSI